MQCFRSDLTSFWSCLNLDTETLVGSLFSHFDYFNAAFGQRCLLIVTLLVVAAISSSMNTILATVPIMLHGIAEQKQTFPQLKAFDKHNLSWGGVVMLAVFIFIPYVTLDIGHWTLDIDSLIMLVIAASTSLLLAYIVAHMDVIVLSK